MPRNSSNSTPSADHTAAAETDTTAAQPQVLEHITLMVEEDDDGQRLDRWLAEQLQEQFSRERLKTLIKQSQVLCNNTVVTKAAMAITAGETITIKLPDLEPIPLQAEDIALPVVYEDDDLLVVNKPRGMLTHPTGRERTGTLVNALLWHCKGQLSGINGAIRPGIVHRLDRDTSGLLVVAKSDMAHRNLSEAIKLRQVHREYTAICQGTPQEPCGTVDAPIGRNPKRRDHMMISETGRRAVTHWQVRENLHNRYSRLYLKLETGRTHQIRVHLAHLGHPIVGDPAYGTGVEKLLRLPPAQGQLLQAVKLAFTHPITHQPCEFELDLAPELQHAWQMLSQTFEQAKTEQDKH